MSKLKKWQKILLLILLLFLIVEIIMIGYKTYKKHNTNKKEQNEIVETTKKEEIDLENYDYYIRGNATEYEKTLFQELTTILSEEEVLQEDYATTIAKLFISDLFTLNNKNNSSDITSSQYVYNDYQETFKTMVKDTIYASIEINIDGKRKQELPIVKNVEITSIDRKSFSLNKEVLDSEAFYINTTISYEKDLKYPTNYQIVIIKNNNLLQVVKAG